MEFSTWLFICNEFDESNTGTDFDTWLENNHYNVYKWYLTVK